MVNSKKKRCLAYLFSLQVNTSWVILLPRVLPSEVCHYIAINVISKFLLVLMLTQPAVCTVPRL